MRPHEIGLALAHQAGIDVDAAHALGAQRAQAEREGDGGIHAAADEEEDVAVAGALADLLLDQRDAMARVPVRHAAADAEDEIREDTPCRAWCGPLRDGTARRRASAPARRWRRPRRCSVRPTHREARRARAPTRVAMAHPDLLRAGEPGEQRVGGVVQFQRGEAVLALLALAHFAAQQVRHELLPVADAEHRLAAAKDRRVHRGTAGVVDAARPAGDDDALWRTASSAAGVSLARTSA